jgi:hypothetical protein
VTVSSGAQDNTLPLLIGYNPGEGQSGAWKGLLDELRIYNRALSLAEIAALAVIPDDDLYGDYNNDGTINAADYTVWRNHLGQTFTLPNEKPNAATPGLVDREDYDFWNSRFGQPGGGGGAGSQVPEPGSMLLSVIAGILTSCRKTNRRRRAAA